MAITKEFIDAVASGKKLRIRIMLKDILIVDPSAAKFGEMEGYAKSVLGNIYDEHNGEVLNYDVTEWNEDYLNEQMVEVVNNFSKERVDLLKSMVRHIYRDKVQKTYSKETPPRMQENIVVRKKHIGIGVGIAGAALTVVGIVTSHTALTIGGVATAVVGGVMVVTDKG